jgi:hypothetical protein
MLGFAVIDNQPGDDDVAVWVVGQVGPQQAGNVNAVTIDRHGDPDAAEKIRSLTRNHAVVLTAGSTPESLPVDGEALTVDDLEDLVRETEALQGRIAESVRTYARKARSKTIAPPDFEPSPKRADFAPTADTADTATQRAFQTANFLNRAWTAWLRTDEQRRRRTVRPKTNETPWMMPEDLGSTAQASLPPAFAARVTLQPQV